MPTHFVTGAGAGIGAAVAEALSARGDDLVLLARNDKRARDLAAAFPGARTVVADLADPDGLAQALRGQGMPESLDSLIHSAGVFEGGAVAESSVQVWRWMLDVNLVSTAELTRLCLPALRLSAGHVIFVNSGAGLDARSQKSAYAASKHGLRALAHSVQAEEAESGVRVTSLYLGRVATGMQAKVHDLEGRPYDPSDWISPKTVAASIVGAIDLPRDAELTELTLRARLRR